MMNQSIYEERRSFLQRIRKPVIPALYDEIHRYENNGYRVIVYSFSMNELLDEKVQIIKIEVFKQQDITNQWESVEKKICSNTEKSIKDNVNSLMKKYAIGMQE